MSNQYKDWQELADKIDWEGGVYEMLFGYGLRLDQLPVGSSSDDQILHACWAGVLAAAEPFAQAVDKLMKLMPEPGEEE